MTVTNGDEHPAVGGDDGQPSAPGSASSMSSASPPSLPSASSVASLASGSASSMAAPAARRRGLSGLRRKFSQTFRLSFHGSLSELASHASALTIEEDENEGRADDNQTGGKEKQSYRKGSLSIPTKFKSFSSLTRKLSVSNSKISDSTIGSRYRNGIDFTGVVEENPQVGLAAESADSYPSTSSYAASNGVKMRHKPSVEPPQAEGDQNAIKRAQSIEEINKRLSLPADLKLPENFLEKYSTRVSPSLNGPMSRATRRQSLSEIGFGRIDTYTKLDKLGEGTYATVFKGKSRLTDNLVALKEIRLEHEEGAPCTAIREVSLLKDLKHNNIVTLHDIVHTETSLTLVFEYLERDLKQYMDDCGGILAMSNVKIFLFQLIRGLAYCHARRILHRDLKPQNLLINEVGELKLADFGLARAKSVPTKTYSNEVVTLWYRPPDVLLGSTEYSTPIDMWGVGCIFYEMASGRPLFPGSTVEDELHLIFKILGSPTEETWPGILRSEEYQSYNFPRYSAEPLIKRAPRLDPDGLGLISRFLPYAARRRISARDALAHAYFHSLGPEIHKLTDVQSVFSVAGIRLTKDPGSRPANYPQAAGGRSRRQSMLL